MQVCNVTAVIGGLECGAGFAGFGWGSMLWRGVKPFPDATVMSLPTINGHTCTAPWIILVHGALSGLAPPFSDWLSPRREAWSCHTFPASATAYSHAQSEQ